MYKILDFYLPRGYFYPEIKLKKRIRKNEEFPYVVNIYSVLSGRFIIGCHMTKEGVDELKDFLKIND